MKKTILIGLFLFISRSTICDVIFFPYPFTGISYSIELITSFESYKKAKSTTNYWAGSGLVGSVIYPSMKSFGIEAAIERRYYFKSNEFKHFFISAYIGGALMTDFGSFTTIGLVPGLKVNYKAYLTKKLVLEPYISFSVPITHELSNNDNNFAFPALTFGLRFGFNRLNDKRPKTEQNAL